MDNWTSLSASGSECLLLEATTEIGVPGESPFSRSSLFSSVLNLDLVGSEDSPVSFGGAFCMFWFGEFAFACENALCSLGTETLSGETVIYKMLIKLLNNRQLISFHARRTSKGTWFKLGLYLVGGLKLYHLL